MHFSKIVTFALAGLAVSSPVQRDAVGVGASLNASISVVTSTDTRLGAFTGGLIGTLGLGTALAAVPVEVVALVGIVEVAAVILVADAAVIFAQVTAFATALEAYAAHLVAKVCRECLMKWSVLTPCRR